MLLLGINAGMFMRDAKARCPHLIVFPYDFGAYEEVADQFYNILHKHCQKVQAVSCDEAFLDIGDCSDIDPESFAFMIRKEIVETTQCTASAGISSNMLMARLATKSAKPNGQCFIPPEKVESFLEDLPIIALPGIGHALGVKLESRRLQTCGQLWKISKEALHEDFGVKIGDMLWSYSRGIDKRKVGIPKETKSVAAEVNWGVRFRTIMDCEHFLVNLSKEISSRLRECGMVARTINLKVQSLCFVVILLICQNRNCCLHLHTGKKEKNGIQRTCKIHGLW
ncbi:DNA repair protein REV1 [Apostasia shenzhenica]|uniref:DNA repair protein REV1 n=1 Tax=Apostasia shenzhenica TaxID=1088818 RepID=A0A2I0B0M0_9ASPA|nr:DNA repair protein REV1 [Apostasia shenzhenica]